MFKNFRYRIEMGLYLRLKDDFFSIFRVMVCMICVVCIGLNMSAKIYPMTSSVNAKALDCQGRSALHYLIQPQLNGSYDNYRLLQQLVAIGAPLEQADKDGKTVMDYAMAQGLTKLATTVQYLLDKEKVKSVSIEMHVCTYVSNDFI